MPPLHPVIHTLVADGLLVWPLLVVYRRVGLSPWWVLLITASLLMPLLGILLVFVPLVAKPWPNFPPLPKPVPPLKRPL